MRQPSYNRRQKTALRAFNRLRTQFITTIEGHRVVDEAFDAGEFSGPAIDRRIEREEERAIRIVADRFEIPDWELFEMAVEWDWRTEARFFEALHRGDAS